METEVRRAWYEWLCDLVKALTFDFNSHKWQMRPLQPDRFVRQRDALLSSGEMLVLAPVIMTRHLLGLYKATITNINGHHQSNAVIILQSIASVMF